MGLKNNTLRESFYQWVGPETVSEHHSLPVRVIFIVVFRELGRSVDPQSCSVHSRVSPAMTAICNQCLLREEHSDNCNTLLHVIKLSHDSTLEINI